MLLLLCAISHLQISFRADLPSDMHKVSVSSTSALTHLHTTGMQMQSLSSCRDNIVKATFCFAVQGLHPQSLQYAAYLSVDVCSEG